MNAYAFSRLLFALLLLAVAGASRCPAADAAGPATPPGGAGAFPLRDRDVVAFLGGQWVVQDQDSGHLESLLAASFPRRGVRFRNLGWEGDTVFEQPRDVNFPGVVEELRHYGATVALLQFGRQESRAGKEGVAAFAAAYEKLCDAVAKQVPRLVLVTPPPFDVGEGAHPDEANNALRLYAAAVRDVAGRRGYACADVFSEILGPADVARGLTDHGTPAPHGAALVAQAAARQLGLAAAADTATRGGPPGAEDGRWAWREMEAVRQAVVAKNRLWSRYRRPINWAFLGGDRTRVPSSHDDRDPSIRWFPAEMEQYVPLIEQAEGKVEEAARAAGVD